MSVTWEPVATFMHRPAAEFVWSLLDGYGIPARVRADDAGGVGGLPLGGATVEVPIERADEAKALIESTETDGTLTD